MAFGKLGKKSAVTAAVAGAMVLALPSVAHAAWEGGWHTGSLRDGCGSATGTYHWEWIGEADGKPLFNTRWDITPYDSCGNDGRKVGIYAKYWKWDKDDKRWLNKTHTYNAQLKNTDKGYNVRDVQLFVCKVGDGNSCVPLHR
ncbi:hypothetical protein [Streptomyces sp. NPDC090022]|uniref:hypothetical protein n=1 Tax=Streptomyces sp. NPDC090022 TaxID=3365920 RepID=UPI0038226B23